MDGRAIYRFTARRIGEHAHMTSAVGGPQKADKTTKVALISYHISVTECRRQTRGRVQIYDHFADILFVCPIVHFGQTKTLPLSLS